MRYVYVSGVGLMRYVYTTGTRTLRSLTEVPRATLPPFRNNGTVYIVMYGTVQYGTALYRE